MGRNCQIWLNFCVIGVFLSSCAAQSSFQMATRTEEIVNRAQLVDPTDPDSERALLSYQVGRDYLGQARFDRATQNFTNAERFASRVLAKKDPEFRYQRAKELDAQVAKEDFPSDVNEVTRVKSGAESQADAVVDRGRGSLSAQALADYLARKNQSSVDVQPPQALVKLPSAKSLPKKIEKPKETRKVPEAKMEVLEEGIDGKEIVERVVAPAKVEAKLAPVLPDDEPAAPDLEEEGASKVESSTYAGPNKRRLSASLNFASKDDKLGAQAMGELDEISRYLVENPSDTIVLSGTLAPGESKDIVERRYGGIKKYLTGRGVPEDQIQLDSAHKEGRLAEFQMFILEH
ncbi:MAG: hypothetical protein COV44_09540 [Deltaproteobacteria bacterium CG11_big_fil_rev_8_21_14_0_20_45_16]|nr:MAG: hypothetical protein COV44_09540 [Deltaproteobacteria bacterium CG11_big_fil_rev_8_21_14_0_20_45_16]